MNTTSLRRHLIPLCAALGLVALALPGCKSQDPAVLLTVNALDGLLIPQEVDTLILSISDPSSGTELVAHTFTLQPGSNFPFTVTLDDSGAKHSQLKVSAVATLSTSPGNQPVAEGDVVVQLQDGATVDAAVNLTNQ